MGNKPEKDDHVRRGRQGGEGDHGCRIGSLLCGLCTCPLLRFSLFPCMVSFAHSLAWPAITTKCFLLLVEEAAGGEREERLQRKKEPIKIRSWEVRMPWANACEFLHLLGNCIIGVFEASFCFLTFMADIYPKPPFGLYF